MMSADEVIASPSNAAPASASTASSKQAKRVVALHKLALADRVERFLDEGGIQVRANMSAKKIIEFARTGQVEWVVVDLSVGSAAPESIVAELMQLEKPPKILATTRSNPANAARRAHALGLDAVYLWPNGVVGQLTEHFPSRLALELRSSERVLLKQTFEPGAEGEGGCLVDLSATGALVEFNHAPAGDLFSLSFMLPGMPEPISIVGQIVRKTQRFDKLRAALKFVQIDPTQQERIREFVRRYNVVSVTRERTRNARTVKVCGMIEGKKRRDYYELCSLTQFGAVLIPAGEFAPPFAPGDVITLKPTRPGGALLKATVQGPDLSHESEGSVRGHYGLRLRFDSSNAVEQEQIKKLIHFRYYLPRKPRPDQRGEGD